MLSTFLADVRYSARSLRARPGFVAVVVLTLALGIGVNVAIFSLFQQILLRSLPVAEPEQLVNLSDPGPKPSGLEFGSISGGGNSVFSYPMFRDLQRAQEPFMDIAAYRIFDASLSTGRQAQRDSGMFVSGSYFPLLGFQPALGRLLGPEDDRVDGQAGSVVLSHAYWLSQFGGDPGVLGRKLIVNGTPLAIVGVAPAGFHGTSVGSRAGVFVPITFRGTDAPASIPNHKNRRFYWVYLFARLKSGVTREEATAAINPLYRAILNEIEAPL
ncbi:MAG TPA: ABC transporter permease, partial [Gammaproteobacteria bacterium]|nr:ABC transporter permease [Gammaproteobacteria bacterium]